MSFFKISIFFLLALPNYVVSSSPTLNKYDTFGFSSPEGIDNFPQPWVDGSQMAFDFQVCPYYTEASTSWNSDGSATVGLFQESGPINLPGIYYNLVSGIFDTVGDGPTNPKYTDMFPTGYKTSAGSGKVSVTSLPTSIETPSERSLLLASLGSKDKFAVTSPSAFEGLLQNLEAGVLPGDNKYTSFGGVATREIPNGKEVSSAAKRLFYSDSSDFTTILPSPLPSASAPEPHFKSSYKRHGLKFKAQAILMPGVKVLAKGGVCQYKVRTNLLEMIAVDKFTALGSGNDLLYLHLFRKEKLEEAFGAFGINAGDYSDWSIEDTFAAVELSAPVTFLSPGQDLESSKESIKLWPTLSAGVWMPTARKPDAAKPLNVFEVPVSNHTHTGGSVSGSVALELPGLIFINSGMSVSFFNTKTIDKYMLPTHPSHSGVSLDVFQVSRKPGKTYLAWIGLFAKNFFENWTAHAQYSITNHLQDEITVVDPVKSKIFDQGSYPGTWSVFQKHLRHTAWTVHEFQAGLVLAMTPNLSFGATFKMTGMGENVPKTNTIMASIKILF